MSFFKVNDKDLVIDDGVFAYTDMVRIMHDKEEICIISENI